MCLLPLPPEHTEDAPQSKGISKLMCTQPLQLLNPPSSSNYPSGYIKIWCATGEEKPDIEAPRTPPSPRHCPAAPLASHPIATGPMGDSTATSTSPITDVPPARPLGNNRPFGVSTLIPKHHVQQARLQHPITLVPHIQQVAKPYPMHWSA